MNNNAVDFLLVEDNPNDVELTLHALMSKKISNQIVLLPLNQNRVNKFNYRAFNDS